MLKLSEDQIRFFEDRNIIYVVCEEYPYITGHLHTTSSGKIRHNVDSFNNESVIKLIHELTTYGELQLNSSSFIYEQIEVPLYELNNFAISHYHSGYKKPFNPVRKYFNAPFKRFLIEETEDYCDFVRYTSDQDDLCDVSQYIERGWKKEDKVLQVACEKLMKNKQEYQERIDIIDEFIYQQQGTLNA